MKIAVDAALGLVIEAVSPVQLTKLQDELAVAEMGTLALQSRDDTPEGVVEPLPPLLILRLCWMIVKLAWMALDPFMNIVVDALLTLATELAPVPDQLTKV